MGWTESVDSARGGTGPCSRPPDLAAGTQPRAGTGHGRRSHGSQPARHRLLCTTSRRRSLLPWQEQGWEHSSARLLMSGHHIACQPWQYHPQGLQTVGQRLLGPAGIMLLSKLAPPSGDPAVLGPTMRAPPRAALHRPGQAGCSVVGAGPAATLGTPAWWQQHCGGLRSHCSLSPSLAVGT